MKFEKWQALGNDYLIVERARAAVRADRRRASASCAQATSASSPTACCCCRHPRTRATWHDLRIFNPDGSEAELSGNGAREAILYLRRRGWTDEDTFAIQTAAGEIRPTITGPDTCRVDMGRRACTSKDFPERTGATVRASSTRAARAGAFSTSRSATRSARSTSTTRRRSRRSTCRASARRSKRHELFPNRTNVSWYTR